MKFWKANNTQLLLNGKLNLASKLFSMEVNVSKCLNRPINKLQAQKISDFLALTQNNLTIDDGFLPDFQISLRREDFMLEITGNLKSALIVLRHTGLISSDETDKAIDIIDKKWKDKAGHQDLSTYNNNFKKASDSFFMSAIKSDYQKTALSIYFPFTEYPLLHDDSHKHKTF